MKKMKWKIEYIGLEDNDEIFEEIALFWVRPSIANNGVYSGEGGFNMSVSIMCLGIDRIIYEEGLTKKEIKKAKEAVLSELGVSFIDTSIEQHGIDKATL